MGRQVCLTMPIASILTENKVCNQFKSCKLSYHGYTSDII